MSSLQGYNTRLTLRHRRCNRMQLAAAKRRTSPLIIMYIESPASPSVYSTLPAACLRRAPSARAHAAAARSHGRTAWAGHSRPPHAVPCHAVLCKPIQRRGGKSVDGCAAAARAQPRVRCTRAAAQRARRRCGPGDRRRHAVSGAHRIARVSLLLGATGDREGARKLGGARLRRTVVSGRLPLRPIAIRPVPTSVRSRLGPFPLRRGTACTASSSPATQARAA